VKKSGDKTNKETANMYQQYSGLTQLGEQQTLPTTQHNGIHKTMNTTTA